MTIFFSCTNINHRKFDPLTCSSIDTVRYNSIIRNHWPSRKPASVLEAVKLLDSIADNNFRCGIVRFSEEDLHFSLGLKIRNDWIRHGDISLKNQLFSKLKLSHIDESSGFILVVYKTVLRNMSDSLFAKWSNHPRLNKEELLKIKGQMASFPFH